jgi:hypothetical protein
MWPNKFNAAIARHDVATILTLLEEEFRVSASSGEFFNSRQERATRSPLALPSSRTLYVRTPDSVEVSAEGVYASETGKWVGSWTTSNGPFRTGGRYAAYWRKSDGRWLLHAELYVPLFCEGSGCK